MCQEFFRTRFITVPIKATSQGGIPIGLGACKAVRLKLNTFDRNAQTFASDNINNPFFVYYGDSQSQECELFATGRFGAGDAALSVNGSWSPKIYCTNLEEVFIRYGRAAFGAWPDTAYVQIMIYD